MDCFNNSTMPFTPQQQNVLTNLSEKLFGILLKPSNFYHLNTIYEVHALLLQRGLGITSRFDVEQVNRGGKITYHGPGQLVLYTISHLRDINYGAKEFILPFHRSRLNLKVVASIKSLEDVLILTLAKYGLIGIGGTQEGNPGVYVNNDKVGAVGLAIQRAVTFHGLSLNVNMNLSPYQKIIPCGIQDKGVTTIAQQLQRDISIEEVSNDLLRCFIERLGYSKYRFLNAQALIDPSTGQIQSYDLNDIDYINYIGELKALESEDDSLDDNQNMNQKYDFQRGSQATGLTHHTVFATPVHSRLRMGQQSQGRYPGISSQINGYQRFEMAPSSQQHIRNQFGSQQTDEVQPSPDQMETDGLNRSGMPLQNGGQDYNYENGTQGGTQSIIWGTNIDSQRVERDFLQFVRGYKLKTRNAQGEIVADTGRGSKYLAYLKEVIEAGEVVFNIDCSDVQDYNPSLYKKIVQYPSEVLSIFDLSLTRLAREQHPQELEESDQAIIVTPFNLQQSITVRELDPKHLDTLISVKGMVTRVSSIIPELRIAVFQCDRCEYELDITNENQKINEPLKCPGCQTANSLQMMHNQSQYWNKQHIKLQESPEQIPEGMTPRSVTLFAIGATLVDYCKPGDRVLVTAVTRVVNVRHVVTEIPFPYRFYVYKSNNVEYETEQTLGSFLSSKSIYKAKPMRENPSQRTLASIFKSYVDVIHIHRETNQKLFSVYGQTNPTYNEATNVDPYPQPQTPLNQGTPMSHDNQGASPLRNVPQQNWTSRHQSPVITQHSQFAQRDNNTNEFGTTNEQNVVQNGNQNNNVTLPDTNEGLFQIENFFRAGLKSREDRIWEVGQSPDIYQKLTDAFAPDIWGMEDIKKGILCLLFGGIPKSFNGGKLRGEINVLIVGDPSVSKSQLLSQAHKIAPRGIYTSGGGSSAVGLTAYVAKDPETKEMVLESGALVLSDMGVCCIDEFDKMNDTTRSTLHEVMEQQTISIAKVGIISTLNARTSVLASANPKESKYDPNLTMVENINLPPTLLSRFDLIYVVLDKTDEQFDIQLAKHLIQQYGQGYEQKQEAPLSQEFLKDYIAFARAKITPKISEEASQELRNGYLAMRQYSAGNKKIVSATPRQLEAAIRLSEAIAKMHLSQVVTKEHVQEALRLTRESLLQSAINPKTGRIDYDAILTGHTATMREQMEQISAEVYAILQEKRSLRLYQLIQELKERNQERQLIRDQDLLVTLKQMEGVDVENGKVTLLN